jgi:hypothetical protein
MTTLTIKLVQVSPTGAHTRFTLSEGGIERASFDFEVDTFDKIDAWQDLRPFVRMIVRIAKRGRTRARLRTMFEAGVDVVL